MDWQRIDTAPKDGTLIDIWANIGGEEYGPTGRLTDCYFKEGKIYQIDHNSLVDFSYPLSATNATHWMPMPAPPKEGEL